MSCSLAEFAWSLWQCRRWMFTTDRLGTVPLPPFELSSGLLPAGEHLASWGEVLERFGWNLVRRRLLDGLAEGLSILADAGCTRVWLNGSFVTAKEEPGDFDAVWSAAGVDAGRLRSLSPEILDLTLTVWLRSGDLGASSFRTSSKVGAAASSQCFSSLIATAPRRGSLSSTRARRYGNDCKRAPVPAHSQADR